MRTGSFSPTSQSSEFSETDQSLSKRLSSENFSVIHNIDKTVAKSRQIIQESLEISRKNNERRQQLEERLKSLVSQSDTSSRVDIVPKAEETDRRAEDSREHSRMTDFRYRYDDDQSALVADLKRRLAGFERIEIEFDSLKAELKETREELRKERLKSRDISDFGVSKSKEMIDTIAGLEDSVRRLKGDLDRKQEEVMALERAVRTADGQRAELVRESELLRQTLADLKKLHMRELEEMEKRLDEAIRARSQLERQLQDSREEHQSTSRRDQESLQTQVSQLESKLRELEQKYLHQMTVNQDLQAQVQSLCQEKAPVPERLVKDFESQMQDNTRRIQELQQRLNESARGKSYCESGSDSELSNEDLRAMVRREQIELGMADGRSSAQRHKPSGKRQKSKEAPRPHSSLTRLRTRGRGEPAKRTYSRCKYCQD